MNPTGKEVHDWCVKLFRKSGFKTMEWPDGTHSLLKVPAKYCSLISSMAAAIEMVAAGEGLPEFKE